MSPFAARAGKRVGGGWCKKHSEILDAVKEEQRRQSGINLEKALS
jgi:hypothetical protein